MISKKFWEMKTLEITVLFERAVKSEIAKTHKAGIKTTHSDSSGTYKLHADGTKEYIEVSKGVDK